MDVGHPLPEPWAELVAYRFRVLGEPMRIRLLDRLRTGETTVTQLAGQLGTSQQNVSKHLGMLYQAGIVRRVKYRNFVRYTIADESVFELCELVCGRLRRQADQRERLLASHLAAEGAVSSHT